VQRLRQILFLLLVAALAACATTPASEDPVLIKLDDLDRRLAAVERILANGSLVELTLQADDMERQAAELLGRIETLEYGAEATAGRQRDLYLDLDGRIQQLEQGLQDAVTANARDGATLAPGQLPVPGGTDRDNYDAAFELLKEQRYEEAAMAFLQFLTSFPDSQLADNAQYWLAESYYVTARFEQALQQFQVVIDDYPRSRKVPDALLKIGYCNYELQHWAAARAALKRVQSDYSDTTAARLAEQRLVRMDDEGN